MSNKQTYRLISPSVRQNACRAIMEAPDGYVCTIAPRARSLDQNDLQFLWAKEVAQALGDRTAAEVQRDWKLRHGIPILRAEDDGFRETYDANLKGLPFEAKLKLMEYIPVTSLMTVKQMSEYLNMVQREALEQGIRLTDPEAQKYACDFTETC